MPDELHSNLEPIDEKDLDLKDKFLGGEQRTESTVSLETENIPSPEQSVERKEGVVEREASYAKILSKMPATQFSAPKDDEITADAAAANEAMDVESKIKNLVGIAETKGIPHAVKVARHMEDNYTLDEFHDRLLADELHDALVKKGLIKEL